MPRVTLIKCDLPGCDKMLEIAEENPEVGVFEILQIVDAMGKSVWLCCLDHAREWLNKYECPYKEPEKAPIEDFLPGEGLN